MEALLLLLLLLSLLSLTSCLLLLFSSTFILGVTDVCTSNVPHNMWGYLVTQVAEALCADQRVACLIRDKVIGIFRCPNPSGHTVALQSTQPLTEISTRDISLV